MKPNHAYLKWMFLRDMTLISNNIPILVRSATARTHSGTRWIYERYLIWVCLYEQFLYFSFDVMSYFESWKKISVHYIPWHVMCICVHVHRFTAKKEFTRSISFSAYRNNNNQRHILNLLDDDHKQQLL